MLFFNWMAGVGAYQMVLRDYFCLCTQESLLMMLGGPYDIPKIEPRLAVCKTRTLPTVLSLDIQLCFYLKDSVRIIASCQVSDLI